MTEQAPGPSKSSSKSSLIVGGIALAIVIVVFVVIGLSQSGDPSGPSDATPPAVVQPDQPHDESVPHTHGPAPTPKPHEHEPHDESVPHTH